MRLLLDTHVLLWWLDDPNLLTEEARTAIRDSKNIIYLSAVVAWEIAIKKALGKLDAPDDLEEVMAVSGFLPLPITIPHVLAIQALPPHHRDPFDRMLIAQALHEGLHLLSRDPEIRKYPTMQIVA